jgi:hypothetical protein
MHPGFLPSFSYFRTAIPKRPVDRCSHDGDGPVSNRAHPSLNLVIYFSA